ncbi:MAG: GntR family transcriptional regulator [Clostridiales bacterium]|nr:GntR family transcriptional regulator [Clostridiales bacterium]
MYLKSNEIPISTDKVYEDMLDKIINLQLEPGRKISENEMCAEYNVSRTVIRRVFTHLNSLNLVEIFPQRGTYISLIDVDYVNDVLFLRNALEKECLKCIIQYPEKDKIIKKLEANLKKQKKFYKCTDYPKEYQILDEEFHNIIIQSVNRKALMEIMEQPLIHMKRWRNLYVKESHNLYKIIDEHEKILEDIKNNDLNSAQKSLEEHIRTIVEASIETTKSHSEYFNFSD